MWTEILKNDVAGIQDFVDIQQGCSDYYKEEITFDKAVAIYNRPSNETMRAFIYRDNEYEINLAVDFKNKTTLMLKTVGLGKFADINIAVDIVIGQVKQLMVEYGVTGVYAIWGDDPYPEVLDFYNRIGNAFNFNNFKETVSDTPRAGVFSVSAKI